ncbi:activating molecule in BECN1-regulated autophagy protein 1-like isoform X2 [Limulus polyphemus]|uniref:Activating molecule in BECN1-regulated autophagy protein 1-like isoform X2 n=1 Tax=Limulus polyphemus TaxID=6850 RepID=A0ABM1TEC1_LIMPO|nr:activating molecule in BECN1-regulated autophagy protein 1-like isoform X2 [Limulus polyphemus]
MVSRFNCKYKHNAVSVLFHREHGNTTSGGSTLQGIAEYKAATSEQEEMHCKLPASVRSTFLTAFSPDGTKVASTHGDHKIYVCDVKTGHLLHVLEGHPRTPWCVAFHPSSNEILASGCLGGEVRVWDLHGGSEVWVAEQNTVITSLAFHPYDRVLVIATFNKIYFWDWSRPLPFATCVTSSDREKVRFVKFNPLGTKLITGISNLPVDSFPSRIMDSVISQGNSSSFSQNFTSQRRSILTRLMAMYRHLEGLEELSRFQEPQGGSSPTQEDALESAREYAEEITTRFLRQRYRQDEVLGTRNEEEELTVEAAQPRTSSLQQPSTSSGARADNTRSQTNEFQATVQRLSSICARLERRMFEQQFLQLQGTTESLVSSSSTSADTLRRDRDELSQTSQQFSALDPRSHPLLNREMTTQLGQEFSLSLADLLRRLQNSLQNLSQTTFASSEAWEQIQQIRARISEILERLSNVSGYRERLTNLRDQIYEAAERMIQRGEENSLSQHFDLAHCLWLVELSLQLTRQMQRILAANYRLTRLHLNATTSRASSSTTNATSNTTTSLLRENDPSTSQFPINERWPDSSLSNREQLGRDDSHLSDIDLQQPSSSEPSSSDEHGINRSSPPPYSFTVNSVNETAANVGESVIWERLPNPFSGIGEIGQTGWSWHETSPFVRQRPRTTSTRDTGTDPPRERNALEQISPENLSSLLEEIPTVSGSTDHDGDNSVSNQNPRGMEENRDSRPWSNIFLTELGLTPGQQQRQQAERPSSLALDTNVQSDSDSNSSSGDNVSQRNSTSGGRPPRSLTSDDLGMTRFRLMRRPSFRIPRVRVEPTLSPPEEEAPLAPEERPRSPPLSTILSANVAGRRPRWASSQNSYFLPDSSFRPLPPRIRAFLGIHNEPGHNLTHRIQWWDFSKFDIPDISDADINVVVPKCKIHNDASVDISSSGELLAALVPNSSGIVHTAELAIYSLSSQTIGQCLYTWSFGPNAISVSLSPLGHYVVVGQGSSRLFIGTSEGEVVAQIFRLDPRNEKKSLVHVYNLTLNGQPHVSLNSVRWLPQPGQGLVYGTNRGTLCICRPLMPSSANSESPVHKIRESQMFNWNLSQRTGTQRRENAQSSALQTSSAATQTPRPRTNTTGTQTFLGTQGEASTSSNWVEDTNLWIV